MLALLGAVVIGHFIHKSMLGGSARTGSLVEPFGTSIIGWGEFDTPVRFDSPQPRRMFRTVAGAGAGAVTGGRSSAPGPRQQHSFQERFASAFGYYRQEDDPPSPVASSSANQPAGEAATQPKRALL